MLFGKPVWRSKMAEGGSLKRKREEDANSSSKTKPGKLSFGHWSQGLLSSMNDPDLVVDKDDQIVIIKDKYPKAKHHFLILPKEAKIPNLKSLKPEHVDLLKHIDKKGRDLADKTNGKLKFRFGYHAVPSMSHLHMHVISQDMDSPCLKHKKHWNSFTTDYFVDSEDIIRMLEKKGKVEMEARDFNSLLKEDLRCHVCKRPIKNIPTLKEHIRTHSYTKE